MEPECWLPWKKDPITRPDLSQANPLQNVVAYDLNMQFNVFLKYTIDFLKKKPYFQVFLQICLHISHLFHAHLCHSLLFVTPKNNP
jgi:hypothetical protein